MKNYIILSLCACLIAFTSCKTENKKTEEVIVEEEITLDASDLSAEMPKTVSFALSSKSGSNAKGKAMFTQQGETVKFEASLIGLAPGTHAIHIHEKSDCSSEDATSSGGHWNPTFKDHGEWGSATGYHKGDIGNFIVDEKGEGAISMTTDQWCIGCDDDSKNILGKAIIVHQGKDDFKSQPSGAAGARVSCGGIIK